MKGNIDNLIICAMAAFGDIPDGGAAPGRFVVLKFGRTEYTKGDRRGAFMFTREDARKILADFADRGKDLVIDYDHQSLGKGRQAPAAGWISSLEMTDAGLEGVVSWTEEGARRLNSREYRYHSPVIFFDKDGHPKMLHSVALTNHPSFHKYAPLVADDNPDKEKEQMNEHLKKLAEMLGLPTAFDDGKDQDAEAAAAIGAKITEMQEAGKSASAFLEKQGVKTFDDVEGRIAGMVPASEKAELEKKLAGIEAEKAVARAFDDGKLVEAQRAWALKYASENPAAFSDFVEHASRVVPMNDVPCGAKDCKAKKEQFSDDDKAILKRMGVEEKDINPEKKEK